MSIDLSKDLDGKKYSVIYADPPWTFKTWSKKGEGRSATQHYGCMNMDDIKNMNVSDVANKDCVLFLWVTDPLLDKQIEVMKSWGFTYKTVGFYWAKLNKNGGDFFFGNGYYTRGNPEQCWIGTRGKPGLPKTRSIRRLVVEPRREHSRKPDSIPNYIEEMYDGPYLELFSRTTRPGWDTWGNEVGKF